MAKLKQAPKPKKKAGSSKQALPESENDFLELADEHERGGGKWKAGDAVKATRFFVRAIETYNAGLLKFPESFDLAYNKAHLQYELYQDPRILPHLGPRLEILKETVQAHRYALRLNEQNADVLFNTAQVLTSLAEELDDEGASGSQENAIQLLQEAVELFSSCLSRQEMEFYERQSDLAEAQVQFDNMAASAETQTEEVIETSSTTSEPAQQWALIEDPITADTLLESALAQLSCLSTLISLSVPVPSSTLASLTEIANPLIQTKISSYISLIPTTSTKDVESTASLPVLSITSNATATFTPSTQTQVPRNPQSEARAEANIAVANFRAVAADAEYRSSLADLETYAVRLKDAFETIVGDEIARDASSNVAAKYLLSVASSYADALDDLAAAGMKDQNELSNLSSAKTLYSVLEKAKATLDDFLPVLSQSQSMVGAEPYPQLKRAQLLLLYGDIRLRMYIIVAATTQQTTAPDVQSLSDADQSYSFAGACASRAAQSHELGEDGTDPNELLEEVNVRRLIVEALGTSANVLAFIQDGAKRMSLALERVRDVASEMEERGLLPKSLAEAIGFG
ncbi:hypothetical protein NA57DRAFT_59530 [Rhizodiscina lignyota]|uniref:Uncharacterized protein n=1 Tax=Rhizodiscina lignyota TaxID=1504668 RepID=A0A9P4I7R3_9PEZI|nr:hypothetical protein NA57DRAFT_59530 [Rhizodiscina lignyota]